MTQEEKQKIALMRYGVIAPLVTDTSNFPSLDAFYMDAALKRYPGPDGSLRNFAASTIEKWYRMYKRHGFDGLLPAGRSDAGKSRKLDADMMEYIRHLKTNFPRLSAAAIHRHLHDDGMVVAYGEVSESTVCRYLNKIQMELKQSVNKDMRRYERPHINEVWCGDSSVGPYLKAPDGGKKKVYIIGLIDDASRFIVGIDVFYNDNFVNLMSVMKSAVAKYGRPKVFNFDNGSAYKNQQMELLAARIGSTLNYCQPYTPTAKAKIERWFRTMKDQWLAGLDIRTFHDLEQLRDSLFTYVHSYNMTPHSSLGGKTPQERFFCEPEQIRRLTLEQVDKAFLLEVERRVSADSVVTIDNIVYEVDYRFSNRRIRLRYSPDLKTVYVVEPDGVLTPIRLLNKQENAIVKREKIHLSKGEDA
jgi:transposase InsO family protein